MKGADGQFLYYEGFMEDIGKRKLAEDQVLEAEKKYRGIFNNALEGMFQTSMSGRTLNANPALVKMLGYDSVEEYLATARDSAHDVWFDPAERERYIRLVEEKGSLWGFECQLKRRDGAPIWVALNTRKTFAADGTPVNEGFIEDITERKQAEDALCSTLQRFYSILSNMNSGVLLVSDVGQVEFANQAECDLFNLKDSPESLVGLSQAEILNKIKPVFPRSEENFARIKEMARANKLVLGEEISLLSGRVFQRDFIPLTAGGKPSGRLWVHTDITERKQAEEALRESLANLQEAQAIGSIGSYLADFSTGVLTGSEVFDRIAGAGAEFDRTPEGWRLLIHPDDRERMTVYFNNEVIGQGKPFDMEYRILRQNDGAVRWVHGLGRLEFDVSGKPIRLSGLVQDITERKLAEEALREREAMLNETGKMAKVGGWALELTTNRLTWTREVYRIHEVEEDFTPTLERAVGFYTPESRPVIAEAVRRAIDHDEPFDVELEIVTARNRRLGVHALGKVSTCSDGTRVLSGTFQDITERKQAVDALREREARLNEAEQVAHLGSSTWDVDTDTTTWSEEMYRITGWDPKVPAPCHAQRAKLYTPESWKRLDAALQNALATAEPYDLELQIVRPDGALRWVRARGKAGKDKAGRVCRLFGTLQDITEQKLAALEVSNSEERFRATFEQAAVGIVHSSVEGRLLRCNARFAEILGYAQDEIPGMTFQQITAPEDLAPSTDVLAHMLIGDARPARWEKRYVRKDGSLTWAKITLSAQRDAEGNVLHFIAIVEDINDRKAAEQSLAAAQETLMASEARYHTVFQTSLDGIAISRLDDGRLIDVNQAYLKILGYERDEVIGHTSSELGMWTDAITRQDTAEMLQGETSLRDVTIPFRRKNGETFWMLLSASVVELDGIPCVLSVIRDTSEMRAAEERIKDLAFHDPLTHLPNRRLLLDRLEQSLAKAAVDLHTRALLFIDLDDFKNLNDTLGHQMGDLLLQQVARRLSACVRGADTVARCGGDEFAVMLESLSENIEEASSQTMLVAEKIRTALSEPYLLAGSEFHRTASIGIAGFGLHPETAHAVLQEAEIAMHEAKAERRNGIRLFTPELQSAVNASATLEEELHQAIKKQQFLLYYQPQVEHGHLTGVEALIRWNHPVRGILPPAEFIRLAEETGLILPMGDWVLETACAQLAAWAGDKRTDQLTIAVNISARQLHESDFVKNVLATLERTGADARKLRLEITESMLLEKIEEIIAKMTELNAHGLRFSLDDFGTGYSSLSYLKRLPLSRMKIDRAFVRDILVDATSGAIAQTIIALSRAMHLSVIAEGVETEEQKKFLVGLGCSAFQGYLFSRPLPLVDFELLLRKREESFADWLSAAR